jgi:hypothetical protein
MSNLKKTEVAHPPSYRLAALKGINRLRVFMKIDWRIFLITCLSFSCKAKNKPSPDSQAIENLSAHNTEGEGSNTKIPMEAHSLPFEHFSLSLTSHELEAEQQTTIFVDFKTLSPSYLMVDYDKFVSSAVDKNGTISLPEEKFSLADACFDYILTDKGMIFHPEGLLAFPESMMWDLTIELQATGQFCTDKSSKINYFNNISAVAYLDPNLVTETASLALEGEDGDSGLGLAGWVNGVVDTRSGGEKVAVRDGSPSIASHRPPTMKKKPPAVPYLPPLSNKLEPALISGTKKPELDSAQIGSAGGRKGVEGGPPNITTSDTGVMISDPPGGGATASKAEAAPVKASQENLTKAQIKKIAVSKKKFEKMIDKNKVSFLARKINERKLYPHEVEFLSNEIDQGFLSAMQGSKLKYKDEDFETGADDGLLYVKTEINPKTKKPPRPATSEDLTFIESSLKRKTNETADSIILNILNSKDVDISYKNYLDIADSLASKKNYVAYSTFSQGLNSPVLDRLSSKGLLSEETKKRIGILKEDNANVNFKPAFYTSAKKDPESILPLSALQTDAFWKIEKRLTSATSEAETAIFDIRKELTGQVDSQVALAKLKSGPNSQTSQQLIFGEDGGFLPKIPEGTDLYKTRDEKFPRQ